MPLFAFEGKSPKIHPTAFIAPTASIIGDVTVEENASVWYNTVIRADFSPIVIRRGANVQDCSVIHVTPAGGTDVGPGATIGRGSAPGAEWRIRKTRPCRQSTRRRSLAAAATL